MWSKPWSARVRVWALVGLVLWCVSLAPTRAHAFAFAWAIEAGLDFTYLKNGLRLDRKPPLFQRDLIGTNLSLSALGLLHFNETFELHLSFDVGELFFGQRTRSGTSTPVVLLNQMQLNWSAQERANQSTAVAQCRTRALQQGVPGSDCQFFSPALAESLLMRELYLRISFAKGRWMRLDVGFRERTIGRGYLYEDYALGLFWEADFRKREVKARLPLRLRFDFFLSDSSFTTEGKQSPVFNASIAYTPKGKSEISAFATYMYDGDRLAAKAVLPMWQDLVATRINGLARQQANIDTQYFCRNVLTDAEYAALDTVQSPNQPNTMMSTYHHNCDVMPYSYGHHFWFGVQGVGHFGRLLLEGTSMLYVSTYEVAIPDVILSDLSIRFDAPRDVDMIGIGMMAEVKATLTWSANWSTGLFFLAISGDHFEPDRQRYYTFVGITPQARYTELFFNGGVNAYSYQQGLGISTVAGKGVLAVGAMINFKAESGVEMKLNASALWSVVPSTFSTLEVSSSGQFYGAEFNFTGGYQLTKWCKLAVKSDLLFPGNFFAAVAPPPVVFRLQTGVSFSFDG